MNVWIVALHSKMAHACVLAETERDARRLAMKYCRDFGNYELASCVQVTDGRERQGEVLFSAVKKTGGIIRHLKGVMQGVLKI